MKTILGIADKEIFDSPESAARSCAPVTCSTAPRKFATKPEIAAASLRTAANFIEQGLLKQAYMEARCASECLLDFILEAQENAGTQRPGTSDAESATRTPMPGSLKRLVGHAVK